MAMDAKTNNMEVKVTGNKMTITVDLTKELGTSASQKNTIVASTKGNQSVPGHDEIKIGLNVYKPV